MTSFISAPRGWSLGLQCRNRDGMRVIHRKSDVQRCSLFSVHHPSIHSTVDLFVFENFSFSLSLSISLLIHLTNRWLCSTKGPPSPPPQVCCNYLRKHYANFSIITAALSQQAHTHPRSQWWVEVGRGGQKSVPVAYDIHHYLWRIMKYVILYSNLQVPSRRWRKRTKVINTGSFHHNAKNSFKW